MNQFCNICRRDLLPRLCQQIISYGSEWHHIIKMNFSACCICMWSERCTNQTSGSLTRGHWFWWWGFPLCFNHSIVIVQPRFVVGRNTSPWEDLPSESVGEGTSCSALYTFWSLQLYWLKLIPIISLRSLPAKSQAGNSEASLIPDR